VKARPNNPSVQPKSIVRTERPVVATSSEAVDPERTLSLLWGTPTIRRSPVGEWSVSSCRRVGAVSAAPDNARSSTQQTRTAQRVGGLEQAHLVGVGARTSPETRFASSLMRVNSPAAKRRLKSMNSDAAPATNGPSCISGSPRGDAA
jgi:hypothetical protein